jgi:hypothetical protein
MGTFDLNKLLRQPCKDDPLLPAPMPLYAYGLDPLNGCIHGYRIAAGLLVDRVRQWPSEQCFLFYPLVFLYRHCIELMLKRLILAFDQAPVRDVTNAQPLIAAELENLKRGKKAHSLQWLWELVRPGALALGNAIVSHEQIEGVKFYIQQLNEIDPSSVSFRYTTSIEQTKAKLTDAQKPGIQTDLVEFGEAMERLAGFLDGLDTYVSEIARYPQEMLEEFHDSFY